MARLGTSSLEAAQSGSCQEGVFGALGWVVHASLRRIFGKCGRPCRERGPALPCPPCLPSHTGAGARLAGSLRAEQGRVPGWAAPSAADTGEVPGVSWDQARCWYRSACAEGCEWTALEPLGSIPSEVLSAEWRCESLRLF